MLGGEVGVVGRATETEISRDKALDEQDRD
jgi:hypothetical protein